MNLPHALSTLSELLALRAHALIAMLVLAFFVGEFLARYLGLDRLLTLISEKAARLVTKLNRANRNVGTRIYRGITVLLMLVLPALIVGLAVAPIIPIPQLLMLAIFGHGFMSYRLWARYRRANAHTLPLELAEEPFLFADSHAVLRYSITHSATLFSTFVVGASFWYLLGGLPFMLGFVVLAEIVGPLRVPVFGWAACSLFRLVNAPPRLLTYVLLALAGLFVPRAKPGAVKKARSFHGFVAYLLGVSLGGAMPGRELAWEGTGTPKLLPEHLARWLLVELAATILLILMLATPDIAKVLNILQS